MNKQRSGRVDESKVYAAVVVPHTTQSRSWTARERYDRVFGTAEGWRRIQAGDDGW